MAAFSLARAYVPGSRVLAPVERWVPGLLAILAAIFALVFEAHPETAFVETGLVCLRIGLECAGAVGVIAWLVARRGAALNPVAAGALSGALAGLSGLALLEIFCPNLNEYHVLVWHLGSVMASAAMGTAIGIVVERIRMVR
jgi:hypothetical protein